MLNIFADALLIASRLGHLPPAERHHTPREVRESEDLRQADALRRQAR
ncbi:hypothetical protein [Tabrizicola aquatica]|nr:hypothetical protein [Tabrizicola aquatica]